ncbi:hypothetical protein EVAR_25919_1 [Eumeta japonica]|uniref:Uncharacterized protein n=1 Tax=Eumeta variegata TaxID=151549 RepID=A0A4C1W2E5_EUMVA|nr:hypothetical protein EVAR_25919_1 [Eumeta japonica]
MYEILTKFTPELSRNRAGDARAPLKLVTEKLKAENSRGKSGADLRAAYGFLPDRRETAQRQSQRRGLDCGGFPVGACAKRRSNNCHPLFMYLFV